MELSRYEGTECTGNDCDFSVPQKMLVALVSHDGIVFFLEEALEKACRKQSSKFDWSLAEA